MDYFWSLFFVLLGASIILNAVFKIDLPFFRIVVALFLFYAGISVLRGWRSNDTRFFADADFRPVDLSNTGFNVVMAKGTLDLSGLRGGALELNVVFSDVTVKYDPAIPLRVSASGAFSNIRMPDGNQTSFGEMTYRSKNPEEGIVLKVSTVFGATRFEAVHAEADALSSAGALR